MKMKRNIKKLLITMIVMILGIGTTSSFAVQDYQGNNALTLSLSYFRYANGEYKDGYALNTVGNEGESHHPVYQIMNGTKTNYYCLNATAGESWLSGTVGTSATYNRAYNLNSQSDIDALKNDSSLSETYKNVVTSKYLKQILWILDNIYIPDTTDAASAANLASKRALLTKAGIVYGDVDNEETDGTITKGYRYIAQTGYDYSAKVSEQGKKGYFYYDKSKNYHEVELPDEIVEVAQQAAIWYFTNYLENNTANSQTYNVKDQFLALVCSNGKTNTNSQQWLSLENEIFNVETDVNNYVATVGKWKQEQAAILCEYLIDAANNYAKNAATETTGSPLTISPATANIAEKKVDSKNYYVVGPIKIDSTRTAVYNLLNTITVNGSTETGAYISNAEGTRNSDQTVANYIGKEFYISVPKSAVTGNNIKIDFEGTYKANKKTLWISTTKTEQPVVEVIPGTEPINLTVNAPVTKEFDLALRKAITALKKAGTQETKLISNEEGKLATRKINYNTNSIDTTGTATYNHRKDPVVVEKGDIVTYQITIYNEGDINGYAKEITDKLPKGLKLHGEATTGTYTSGNVKYSYVYNEDSNTITFTNVSKNVLTAYDGGNTLSSETIEIECEVAQEPATSKNTYLTNIAYITKEYNSEANTEVTKDRDSDTTKNPSAEQNTTGDKYNGYHGGDNKNGDNSKDVYNDGTNNDDYFPGKEDDDDFEVVVVKPATFDLALQKYISNIYSNGTNKAGRKEPTIDTTKLANKTATTATYTQDKTPIRVKSGDYVTYTFTVYNEGDIDGYVDKITDNIPTGLQFVYPKQPTDGKTLIACDSQGKTEELVVDTAIYNSVSKDNASWSIDQKDGKLATDTYNGETTTSITCDVKSYLNGTNKLLKAYDSSKDTNKNGDVLDKTSVTVILRVSAQDGAGVTIRNEAAITEAEDSNGNKQDATDLKDRDSQTNKWPGKDGDKNYQDDEDYDNIILGNVDLALTKFITAVSNDTKIEDGEYLTTNGKIESKENPYTRATKVETKELRDNKDCHDATYIMVKDPLTVPAKSYVLYNIRVYNEGETDVYAGEITDHLPDYLDYVDCDFNTAFGWKVGSDGKTIKTSYLGYNEKDKEAKNLLKAFDKKTDDGEGLGLDYRDVQVLCRVNDNAPTNTNIVNVAEITKYQDPDGEDIPKDIDSTPDNVDKKNEDDDDYEVINIKTFDLSLLKYVSTVYVTEDGKTTTSQTGNTGDDNTDKIPKVEVNKKKLDSTVVKFGYTIKITNEGDIAGYAKEITDYVPEGLKFYAEDNNGWTDEGNNVISTKLLENTLLQPGESAEVTVILRWINGSTNLGLKTNTAEISEDYNDEGIPDRDSTPDNKKPGEDDIDDASVLLSIKTGILGHMALYITYGAVIFIVFIGGIILIKKYVL